VVGNNNKYKSSLALLLDPETITETSSGHGSGQAEGIKR
jgi:hypothetical protein